MKSVANRVRSRRFRSNAAQFLVPVAFGVMTAACGMTSGEMTAETEVAGQRNEAVTVAPVKALILIDQRLHAQIGALVDEYKSLAEQRRGIRHPHWRGHYGHFPAMYRSLTIGKAYLGYGHLVRMKKLYAIAGNDTEALKEQAGEMLLGDPFMDLEKAPTTGCSAAAWATGRSYGAGDVVSYGGGQYTAAHWSYNERPDLRNGAVGSGETVAPPRHLREPTRLDLGASPDAIELRRHRLCVLQRRDGRLAPLRRRLDPRPVRAVGCELGGR